MSKNEEYYSFMKSSPTRAKKQEESKQRNSLVTNNYDDLMQSVMQIGYRFGKWSTFKSIELKQDEPAWLLGKEFTPKRIQQQQEEGLFSLNPEESKRERAAEQIKIEEQMKNDRAAKSEKMLQIYTNTLLFTYRKNFMYLLHDFPDDPLNKKYTSDYGWGCMIRTGQMILAEALKKHLKKKDYVDPHQLSNIILGFCEDEEKVRPYSIHEIARLAFKKYQIYPGKWYTPVLICYVLRDLHRARKIKGSENLKIFVSGSDKPMVFEKLLAKMLGSNKKLNQIKSQVCQHQKSPRISNLERRRSFSNDSYEKIGPFICSKKKNIIDEDDNEDQDRADNVDEIDDKSELVCTQCAESVNSLLLLIPSKLGVDEINESHQQIIKRFLSSPYSVGMIGGRPSKAHYFLGFIGNELLYLDPHWIQESFSPENQLQDNLQTFFSKEVHKISLSKISSSLAFGFLFLNLGELNAFYASLRQLEREYGDDFFLVIEREYPSYAQSSEKELTKLVDRYQRQTDKEERKLKQQKRKEDTKNKAECSLIHEMKEGFETYDDASSYRDSERSNSNSSNSDSQSDGDENPKKILEDVEKHQPSAYDLENDQIEAEERGGCVGSGNVNQKNLMNICGDKKKIGMQKFYEYEDDYDIS